MYEARAARVWPGLDDKVLTAWNGLMLAAFAEAGRVFENETYTRIATANAEFLFDTMRRDDGQFAANLESRQRRQIRWLP